MHLFFFPEPYGQTWLQIGELTLALILSSLIGFEREFRMKSAGLRTHTLVGVAAALIMLVSKYGFGDIISKYEVVLDPSRVAAQIVSGIGFIGGGLIFVQKDVVRGLTTAAIIWLTASVGMACGAGLPILAVFVTGAHFLVVFGYRALEGQIRSAHVQLQVRYAPGRGAVEKITQLCTGRGFQIQELAVIQEHPEASDEVRVVNLRLQGRGKVEQLVLSVGDVKGVVFARALSADQPGE
jgi:putative Mg2+ transporter-C (MgtC) family protein